MGSLLAAVFRAVPSWVRHGLVVGLLYEHPRPCRLNTRKLGSEAQAYVLGFRAARSPSLERASDPDSVVSSSRPVVTRAPDAAPPVLDGDRRHIVAGPLLQPNSGPRTGGPRMLRRLSAHRGHCVDSQMERQGEDVYWPEASPGHLETALRLLGQGEAQKVGHLESAWLGGGERWLPVRLHAQERQPICLQKTDQDLGDDPTTHRAEA